MTAPQRPCQVANAAENAALPCFFLSRALWHYAAIQSMIGRGLVPAAFGKIVRQ